MISVTVHDYLSSNPRTVQINEGTMLTDFLAVNVPLPKNSYQVLLNGRAMATDSSSYLQDGDVINASPTKTTGAKPKAGRNGGKTTKTTSRKGR